MSHDDSARNVDALQPAAPPNTQRFTPARAARRLLAHPRFPWVAAAVAMLLCMPALWIGLQTDDHFYRATLSRDFATWRDSPARARLIDYIHADKSRWRAFDLFAFIKGDQEFNRRAIAGGFMPWWAPPDLKISFFRPLTALTHWLDYRLWPHAYWLMHLHSLLWFGAVVVVVALLYRRLLGAGWVAGLAALLFAIDDAHGFPAVWLANRNALLAAFFGVIALLSHGRWRSTGLRLASVVAAISFLLALLANEGGVATFGYLLAFALFLDRAPRAARLRSLLPYVIVGAIWWFGYKLGGYGASGSGLYLDPGAQPFAYVVQAVDRVPRLLFGQWALPSDMQWMMSQRAAGAAWWIAVAFLLVIAALLVPLIRRDRVARFWALGMLISIAPACATFASDRLLVFAGIGGMGLLAQLIAAVLQNAREYASSAWRKWPARVMCGVLCLLHLIGAPLGLMQLAGNLKRFDAVAARAGASLPWDESVRDQTVLIVNTPTFYVSVIAFLIRALDSDAILPKDAYVLGSGLNTIEVRRPDADTLIVSHAGGFLAAPGSPEPGREHDQPLFDQRYGFAMLDQLYRGHRPMRVGEQIELHGITVEITAITADVRPAEAAFHFAKPLDDPSYRWLRWEDGVYVPFTPPRTGESVTLPRVSIGF